MAKTEFTIEEIRNYLTKSDSFGDAVHFLSAEAIIKANEPGLCTFCKRGQVIDRVCDNCGGEYEVE